MLCDLKYDASYLLCDLIWDVHLLVVWSGIERRVMRERIDGTCQCIGISPHGYNLAKDCGKRFSQEEDTQKRNWTCMMNLRDKLKIVDLHFTITLVLVYDYVAIRQTWFIQSTW